MKIGSERAGALHRFDVIVRTNGLGEERRFRVLGFSRAAAASADRIGIETESVETGHRSISFYDLDEPVSIEVPNSWRRSW